MTSSVTLPLWLFVLILLFAAVTFASHFLFPSVRWFFRRRMERAVARLNEKLERPIQPFKLLRRHDMIQRLIYDPEVTQAIVQHAKNKGVREDVAFERARSYAREIVPSFSASAYFGVAIRVARWLSNSLYHVQLGFHDEAALKAVDRDATIVFVMNHRSNMDYVLVTYLAADRSALSYAVGEWAQVWPLSKLIKAMGAYFIQRKARDALYRRVLSRYVHMATAAGVTQAMFPEGGLTLDGALAPPKLGLLKYITNGIDLEKRDVVFVPVALNYDRVLEDNILISAATLGERRFDARISRVARGFLRQIWLRLTGNHHRFGFAAVNFGEPISLRKMPEFSGNSRLLSREVMSRIAKMTPVLPVPLLTYILLEKGPLTRVQLEIAVHQTLARIPLAHVHLPQNSRGLAVERGLAALNERDVVACDQESGIYAVSPEQRDVAEFYANSIRHLFPDD